MTSPDSGHGHLGLFWRGQQLRHEIARILRLAVFGMMVGAILGSGSVVDVGDRNEVTTTARMLVGEEQVSTHQDTEVDAVDEVEATGEDRGSSLTGGSPYYSFHFDPLLYGGDGQVWAIEQMSQGPVVVAELGGLYLFDGELWERLDTPKGVDSYLSLAADAEGRVWVGGNNELGVIEGYSEGVFEYRSLTDTVPDSISIGEVWGTHFGVDGPMFQTRNHILMLSSWDDDVEWEVITDESIFHTSWQNGGQTWVNAIGDGLGTIQGGALKTIAGGEEFSRTGVYGILERGEGEDAKEFVVVTRGGLWLSGQGGVRRFTSEIGELLQDAEVYKAVDIEGGWAFGTIRDGVYLTDREGRVEHHLTEGHGLHENTAHALHYDREQGLWVGGNSRGVMRLNAPAEVTAWGENEGVRGTVNALARGESGMYVGTTSGLWVIGRQEFKEMVTRVGDIVAQVWSIKRTREGMMVATDRGLYFIDEESGQDGEGWSREVVRLSDRNFISLASWASENGEKVLAGSRGGISVLSYSRHEEPGGDQSANEEGAEGETRAPADLGGRWEVAINPIDVEGSVWSMAQIDSQRLWVESDEGMFEVIMSDDGSGVRGIQSLGEEIGMPGQGVLSNEDGRVMLLSTNQLYRYNRDRARFEETALGSDEGSGILVVATDRRPSESAIIAGDGHPLIVMYEDGTVERGVYDGGEWRGREIEGMGFEKERPAFLHVEKENIWIGSGERVIRYRRTEKRRTHGKSFEVVTRELRTVRRGVIRPEQRNSIPFENNDVVLRVAAATFVKPLSTEYRWRLVKPEILNDEHGEWSPWVRGGELAMGELREGRYTIEVEARNGLGVVVRTVATDVRVLPPWYRQWWAYLIFAMSATAVFFTVRQVRKTREERRQARRQEQELEAEREARKQLQNANEALERANKLKDEFVANTSHEFRTPLTAIMGFTDVLLECNGEGEMDEEMTEEFLTLIGLNARRLHTTVESILQLSKVRSGTLEPSLRWIDPVEVCEETVARLKGIAESHRVTVEIESSGTIWCMAEGDYLAQCLANLLSNAIKFSEADSKVLIRCEGTTRDGSQWASVSVQDWGQGMDEGFLPFMFDEFTQESTGESRSHEGSGLGLSITKGLVDAMGGMIEVETEKDEGTTFTILLPLQGAGGDGERAGLEDDEGLIMDKPESRDYQGHMGWTG